MAISETDVAIIGAGAAGLGAAMTARAAGLSFHIFEAADRVGGRAHTVGIPGGAYDLGCHFLHGGPHNLFSALAFAKGLQPDISITPGRMPEALFLNGERQSEAERDACADYYLACFEAMEDSKGDASCGTVLDQTSRFYPIFRQWFGAIEGLPPEEASLADYRAYRELGFDWPVPSGYGALIAGQFKGLPVALSTPANAIDLTGSQALITTPHGTVRAKAVVVTVSVGVLAAGGIQFTPALPDSVQQALSHIAMGYAERVCLLLDKPAFGGESLASHAVPTDNRTIALWFNESGAQTIGGYLAGDLAADVARDGGSKALIAYTEDAAVEILGSDLRSRIQYRVSSAWTVDPNILGGYSVARPGGAGARSGMETPVHDRLMIAGEAWTADQYGTAHGAYANGSAAVTQLVRTGVV